MKPLHSFIKIIRIDGEGTPGTSGWVTIKFDIVAAYRALVFNHKPPPLGLGKAALTAGFMA